MSSSDRQFQYVPRYKHFVKAPFIKRHRTSSATHCYVLYGSSLAPMMPVRSPRRPLFHLSRIIGQYFYGILEPHGFHCCHMVYRKPSINVHISPKGNPAICFIRSCSTPVATRLSSRIGFSILCCYDSPQYIA